MKVFVIRRIKNMWNKLLGRRSPSKDVMELQIATAKDIREYTKDRLAELDSSDIRNLQVHDDDIITALRIMGGSGQMNDLHRWKSTAHELPEEDLKVIGLQNIDGKRYRPVEMYYQCNVWYETVRRRTAAPEYWMEIPDIPQRVYIQDKAQAAKWYKADEALPDDSRMVIVKCKEGPYKASYYNRNTELWFGTEEVIKWTDVPEEI